MSESPSMQPTTPPPEVAPSKPAGAGAGGAAARLGSLDAFRGFTMFWLMGGKALVVALAALVGLDFVRYQLGHSEWEGLRYYDLIWPSFMLMVGVSIPLARARRASAQSAAQMRRDAWRRAAILFLLGSFRASLHDGAPRWIELSSALQPIAVAYIVAVHLADRTVRTQIAATTGILAGYALLLAFVGTAGVPAGTYEPNHNLVTTVDRLVLGRAHADGWGTVLSTIPAIATTLVGLLFGQVLRRETPATAKLKVFALTGLGCLAAGYGISPVVPIIMKLWTSSYGLVATGWACLLFSGFYWVIDLRGWRGWEFPLAVIGMNALAAYLMGAIIPVSRIMGIFTKPLMPALGAFGPVVSTGAVFGAGWLILFWFYRRKIFLRP